MTTYLRPTGAKLLSLLLVILLLAVGCTPVANTPPAAVTVAPQSNQTPNAPAKTVSANAPKEIVIGAALPLTGGQAREGGLFKDAYEMAVAEVNSNGGLMLKDYGTKAPVRLIIYDDKSDNTTSVSLYEKLATEDKVDAFLGGYSTPLVQAQTVIPQKYSIPYIGAGGATGAIYERGNKWIFGLLANIAKLSQTLLTFMSVQQDAGKLPKPMKLAVLAENSSHGQEFSKGFNDGVKAAPDRFQIGLADTFELNAKDFTPLLQKVKSANADALLVDARINDYILMQRQYTENGLYHKLLSYGPRGPEQAARDALDKASDYIFAANWWDRSLQDPASKAFTAKYEAKYTGKQAEWFAALGYEATQVLFKAIEQVGSLDKAKVRDALAATDLKDQMVVGGEVKFNAHGQIENDYIMTQNMPGKKVTLVYPKSLANGDAVVPMPK